MDIGGDIRGICKIISHLPRRFFVAVAGLGGHWDVLSAYLNCEQHSKGFTALTG
jgi:hypothetical protein